MIFGFGEGAWLSGRGLPEGPQDSPRREERLGQSSHLGGTALMRCFGGEVMVIAADQMWGGEWGEEGDPKVQLMWLGGVVPVSRLGGQIGGAGPGRSDARVLKKQIIQIGLKGPAVIPESRNPLIHQNLQGDVSVPCLSWIFWTGSFEDCGKQTGWCVQT